MIRCKHCNNPKAERTGAYHGSAYVSEYTCRNPKCKRKFPILDTPKKISKVERSVTEKRIFDSVYSPVPPSFVFRLVGENGNTIGFEIVYAKNGEKKDVFTPYSSQYITLYDFIFFDIPSPYGTGPKYAKKVLIKKLPDKFISRVQSIYKNLRKHPLIGKTLQGWMGFSPAVDLGCRLTWSHEMCMKKSKKYRKAFESANRLDNDNGLRKFTPAYYFQGQLYDSNMYFVSERQLKTWRVLEGKALDEKTA